MKITHLFEGSVDRQYQQNAVLNGPDLYRGLSREVTTTDIFEVPIRTDRVPLNTSHAGTILFNVLFERATGHADVRRRALFCSLHIGVASEYGWGSVVNVYPLKTATIAYHPNIDDSMTTIGQIEDLFEAKPYGADLMDALEEATSAGKSAQTLERVLSQMPDIRDDVETTLAEAEKIIDQYVVGPAEQLLPRIKSHDAEVMIFDSPYAYCRVINDEDDDDTLHGVYDDE